MVGVHGVWRLKKARFSISIAPLNVSPSENAASAPAVTVVSSTVPGAALVDDARDRRREHSAEDARRDEGERDLAEPERDGVLEAVQILGVPASRDSRGNSTVAIATENIPCGSM